MSLVRRDSESFREVLDDLRLPNVPNPSSPVVVFLIRNEGHFYNNPINHVYGNSILNQGDLGTMSYKNNRPSLHNEQPRAVTSSASEHDATDADRQGPPGSSEAPPEFKTREYGWFRPGRYLKIWAREGDNVDIDIHNKEFILLDTKNIEGPGLLVRQHATDHCHGHRGSFNRTHVLLKNHPPSASESGAGALSSSQIVYMDAEEDEVAENTFIELEHAHNIPFQKYKCIDYGVLSRSSLTKLRGYYVDWQKYDWNL